MQNANMLVSDLNRSDEKAQSYGPFDFRIFQVTHFW